MFNSHCAPYQCSFTPCVNCGHYKESHKNFGFGFFY